MKKIGSFLLCCVISLSLLFVFAEAANAASDNSESDYIAMSIFTDRAEYRPGETVKIQAAFTNISDSTVKLTEGKIIVPACFSHGNSNLKIAGAEIKSGETIIAEYELVVNGKTPVKLGSPDKKSAIITAVIAAAVAVLAVAVVFVVLFIVKVDNKVVRIISFALAIIIAAASGIIAGVSIGKMIKNSDVSVDFQKNLLIDGEETSIGLIAEAKSMDDNKSGYGVINMSYQDLSHGSRLEDDDINEISFETEGSSFEPMTVLEFYEGNPKFTLSEIDVPHIEEALDLKNGGYTEIDGHKAFYVAPNTSKQAGFTVNLNLPVLAKNVSKVTITIRSTLDTPDSTPRILKSTTKESAQIENTYQSCGLKNCKDEFVTYDLNLSNISAIADSSGYIKEFKLYIRDRNSAGYYIENITFVMDFKKISSGVTIDKSLYGKADTMNYLMNSFKERLMNANIKANTTITATAFTHSTEEKSGGIIYNVTYRGDSGEDVTVEKIKITTPALTDMWLLDDNSPYGSSHDIGNQLNSGFDPSGILNMSDISVGSLTGVKAVKYAVVSNGTDIKDKNVLWFKPQYVRNTADTIEKVFVNAFLDYGDTLKEGGEYTFALRAETEGGCYISLLEVPFTYTPYDKQIADELINAKKVIENFTMTYDGDLDNMNEAVFGEIKKAVDNERIFLNFEESDSGYSSKSYKITLGYSGAVSKNPVRSFDTGECQRTDFYNVDGNYMSVSGIRVFIKSQIDGKSIGLISPDDGSSRYLVSDIVYEYMELPEVVKSTIAGYADGNTNEICTVPVEFKWEDKGDSGYVLLIASNPEFSDAMEYHTSDACYTLWTLETGRVYYWKVTGAESGTSPTYLFTAKDSPRWIKLDGVYNFRDIGGFKTVDGKRIRESLAYRSGVLTGATKQDIEIINNVLNMKTEIDLRGTKENVLGKQVNIIPSSAQWYGGIFNKDVFEEMRIAISAFAYEENYPLVFHCSLGRDRTGTLSALILGLCGVDKDTVFREYMLSWYTAYGNMDGVGLDGMYPNITSTFELLEKYSGADKTFAEQIEKYMLDIGVTSEEINSIRSILVEDAK